MFTKCATNCANNCVILHSRINFLQGVAACFIYLNGLFFMILSVSDKLQAKLKFDNFEFPQMYVMMFISFTQIGAGGIYLLDKCFNFEDVFMSTEWRVISCIILNAFISGIMIPTMPWYVTFTYFMCYNLCAIIFNCKKNNTDNQLVEVTTCDIQDSSSHVIAVPVEKEFPISTIQEESV